MMTDHKNSNGQPCTGCGPDCAQARQTIIVGGIACTGCCAMLSPHGTFVFDDDGNCTQEPACCSGKECQDETPQSCDAHAPNVSKGHVVEIRAPFVGGRFPEQKAQAVAAKVRALVARDQSGAPIGDRVSDAGLTFTVDASGNGEVVARVTALEERTNPHNPDPEWHHVTPGQVEVAAVRTALGAN